MLLRLTLEEGESGAEMGAEREVFNGLTIFSIASLVILLIFPSLITVPSPCSCAGPGSSLCSTAFGDVFSGVLTPDSLFEFCLFESSSAMAFMISFLDVCFDSSLDSLFESCLRLLSHNSMVPVRTTKKAHSYVPAK